MTISAEKLAAAIDRLDIRDNGDWDKSDNRIQPTKWFVVDTSTADHDVNWPGDLVSEHDSLAAAKIGLAEALIAMSEEK